jgi:hypothetical protein
MLSQRIGVISLVASLASLGSAQKLIFNFEQMTESFSPYAQNSAGQVIGATGSGAPSMWSRSNGFAALQNYSVDETQYDSLVSRLDNAGNAYGITFRDGQYSLSKWNSSGVKTTLRSLTNNGSGLVAVDVDANGDVLFQEYKNYQPFERGYPYTNRKTFIYRAATGAVEEQDQSFYNSNGANDFRATGFGRNGTIIGVADDARTGESPFGGLGSYVRLNPQQTLGSAGGFYWKSFDQRSFHEYGDGTVSERSYRWDFYYYDTSNQLTGAGGQNLGTFNGYGVPMATSNNFASYLNGGFAFGTRSYSFPGDRYINPFYSVNGDLTLMDATSYEGGSPTIESFLGSQDRGDGRYVFGQDASGNTYVGTFRAVPEPLTMTALVLGVAGLARRRRAKNARS